MANYRQITMEKENLINNEDNKDNLNLIEKELKGIDEQKYLITIIKSEKSIIFNVKSKNDYLGIIYKKEITLDSLYNLNKFFKQYLTIEDLFINFFGNTNDIDIIVSKKENENERFILLKFSKKFCANKEEFIFILYPEKQKVENLVFKLYEKI